MDSVHVSLVSYGALYTVVMTTEGRIYAYGISNDNGRTGHDFTTGRQIEPKMVEALSSKKVIFVATGAMHTACICEDGEIYTWGRGESGELGHGDETSRVISTLVNELAGKKATETACGYSHTLVRINVATFTHLDKGKMDNLDMV